MKKTKTSCSYAIGAYLSRRNVEQRRYLYCSSFAGSTNPTTGLSEPQLWYNPQPLSALMKAQARQQHTNGYSATNGNGFNNNGGLHSPRSGSLSGASQQVRFLVVE